MILFILFIIGIVCSVISLFTGSLLFILLSIISTIIIALTIIFYAIFNNSVKTSINIFQG